MKNSFSINKFLVGFCIILTSLIYFFNRALDARAANSTPQQQDAGMPK